MARATYIQTNGTAGELSPGMKGRVDFAKYYNGFELLRNQIIFPQGGWAKRPGWRFVAEAKNADKDARLIPFEFNVVQTYMLEFGEDYIRFYKDQGQIQGGTGAELCDDGDMDVPSHWTTGTGWSVATSVATCDGSQVADSDLEQTPAAGITEDEDYYVVFTLNSVDAGTVTPVLGDQAGTARDAAGTYAEKITAGAGGKIILRADSDFEGELDDVSVRAYGPHEVITTYSEAEVGELWAIQSADVLYLFHADHPPRKLSRTGHTLWDLEEAEFIDGPYLKIEDVDATLDPDGTSGSVTLTASVDTFTEQMVGALVRWMADDSKWYWFLITAYTSATEVTATVMGIAGLDSGDLPNHNASGPFRIGAWGEHEGYPAIGGFHEQSLIAGYTDNQPDTLWGSVKADFDSFAPTDEDGDPQEDNAFTYTLASQKVNTLIWIASSGSLLVGTHGDEWKGTAPAGEAINPVNPPQFTPQTSHGSAPVPTLVVDDAVLFVQRHGKRLREIVYKFDVDRNKANDLTILADHLMDAAITAMSFQAYPYSQAWLVNEDGYVLTCTYYASQEINGWSRQETQGEVKSIATIPSTVDNRDETWFIVERTVGGSTVKYVEFAEKLEEDDIEDCFYVDSGLTFHEAATITGATAADPVVITAVAHGFDDGDLVTITGVGGMTELNYNRYQVNNAATDTFELQDADGNDIDGSGFTAYTSGGLAELTTMTLTGADHLAGETAQVLANGSPHPEVVVGEDGSVELERYVTKAHVGLGYTAYGRNLPLEVGSSDGTAQGKIQRIHQTVLRLLNSVGGKIGPDEDHLTPLQQIVADVQLMDEPLDFQTGDFPVNFEGDYERAAQVYWEQDQPLPMRWVALITQVETTDV